MAQQKQNQGRVESRKWIGVGVAILLVFAVGIMFASLLAPKSIVEIRPDSGKFEISAHPTGVEGSETWVLVFKTNLGVYSYNERMVRGYEIADDQPEFLVEEYGRFGDLQRVKAYVHASRRTR